MTEAETAVREALAKVTPEQKQRAREYAARFWEGTALAYHYRAGSMDRTSAVGATAFAVMAGDAREAALLAELDAARAEVARLQSAIDRQAAAVRTLHANEETEINRLRRKQQEWHQAIATLDSERQANAMLTAEVERLREALEYVAEHCDRCGGAGALLAHDHVTAKDLWEDCTLCAPARAALQPRP